jgi:hypothetical protein
LLGNTFNYSATQRINDPTGTDSINFGFSSAISQNIVLVGSPDDLDENDQLEDIDENSGREGRIYIFEKVQGRIGKWNQIKSIKTTDRGDKFGSSLSLHDSDLTAVVGAPRCDGLLHKKSGCVYILDININRKQVKSVQYKKIFSPLAMTDAYFGHSVALSPHKGVLRCAVGAYGHAGTGAVFLYTRDSGTGLWGDGVVVPHSGQTGGRFGWSVAMSGRTLAVGSPQYEQYGAVSLYTYNDKLRAYNDQELVLGDTRAATDYFGESIAVSETSLLVGCPHSDKMYYLVFLILVCWCMCFMYLLLKGEK